jgi:hypothetical protein
LECGIGSESGIGIHVLIFHVMRVGERRVKSGLQYPNE